MAKRQFRNAKGAGSAEAREAQKATRGGGGGTHSIFKPGTNAALTMAKWKGRLPLTFRPFPCVDPESESGISGTRFDPEDGSIHAWSVKVPIAHYVGFSDCQQCSFIPFDINRELAGEDVRSSNPYMVLQNAFKRVERKKKAMMGGRDIITTKQRIDWLSFTAKPAIGSDSSEGCMPYIKFDWLIQGLVYQNVDDLYVANGNPPRGAGEGDYLQVMCLRDAVFQNLLKQLWKPFPEMRDKSPADYSEHEYYGHGDIVDPTNGKFITVYRPETHLNMVKLQGLKKAPSGDAKGYIAYLHRKFTYVSETGQHASIGPNYEEKFPDILERSVRDWPDLLKVPETDELCLMLARAFKRDPLILEYGWSDYPQFFTNEVNGILGNRTQATVQKPAATRGSGRVETGVDLDVEDFDSDEFEDLDDGPTSLDEQFDDLEDSFEDLEYDDGLDEDVPEERPRRSTNSQARRSTSQSTRRTEAAPAARTRRRRRRQ